MHEKNLRPPNCKTFPFALALENANGEPVLLRFELLFDARALVLIEKKFGISAIAELDNIFKNLNVERLTFIFWAAAQARHPEYAGETGLEMLRSYLTYINFGVLYHTLYAAFVAVVNGPAQQSMKEATEEVGAVN